MFQDDLLKGKRALITGGGTGLGKNIGRRYAELGANLVICGRRIEKLADDIPLRRVGERPELSNLAAYLVSDEAGYINGEIVVIDDGKSLQGIYGLATQSMQNWDDAKWASIAKKTRGR